ncbi:(2Fe-2S)-binding protein [Streptomyces albidus (ex Kaewkla and Franco 2022)]|uniref:(2Fe-2S)-binding protein n=1 Tax=Streptomyces albidus (ex Kaewkla and Franco 2022) TaxID=722709 RepID=UPI0015EFA28C|nr:(2Fe-2S)-binding protein [Streptomyces albidus (ex Kaewkla and Franco 2022)]
MYICSCFGITERQVREHAEAGACTPRQIASASKAGTDCGSCVRRIQGLLGRGACPRRQLEAAAELPAPMSVPASLAAEVVGEAEENAGVAEAA